MRKEISPYTGERKYDEWQIGYYIKGLPESPHYKKRKITKLNYRGRLDKNK